MRRALRLADWLSAPLRFLSGLFTPLVSDPDFVVGPEARDFVMSATRNFTVAASREFIASADRDFNVAIEARSFTV